MLVLGPFWCSVVTSVTFSSDLSNFEKNQKNPTKKNPTTPKISKNLKLNPKKSEKKKKKIINKIIKNPKTSKKSEKN